jgi:replicative DNA helicase
MGKTSLLVNIGLNAAKHGKKVAIFSLEMSRAQVAQRLASQMTEIDLQTGIMQGHLTAEEWEKYVKAVEEIEKLPININDLSEIDINQVRQTARKLKPDLVILDYIQLAQSGEKRSERRELEVSAVSRGLKYLARELNVPVLAAAQLNRAVDNRKDNRPILSDLRESGSLEQDAYSVMFIHRAVETSNLHEIIIAKHRNGPVGSVDLMGRLQYAKFVNASNQEEK